MERHQRQTRKPRLFRLGRYKTASAAVLLTLGSQWAVAAAPTRVQTGAFPESVDVSAVNTRIESTTVVTTGARADRPQSTRTPATETRRSPIGWAVALLLAGVAVGRHAVATDEEAD